MSHVNGTVGHRRVGEGRRWCEYGTQALVFVRSIGLSTQLGRMNRMFDSISRCTNRGASGKPVGASFVFISTALNDSPTTQNSHKQINDLKENMPRGIPHGTPCPRPANANVNSQPDSLLEAT